MAIPRWSDTPIELAYLVYRRLVNHPWRQCNCTLLPRLARLNHSKTSNNQRVDDIYKHLCSSMWSLDLFIRPWLRLFEDRIVVAPELITAIEQKSAQLELFRNGDLRIIRLVSYTAPCPVCGATVHLDNGEPDFPRRLVGRCADSPREHIFSFDRVTKKGSVLRSPNA